MSTALGSRCCDAGEFVCDNGFCCCVACGKVASRELDVRVMSFAQSVPRRLVYQQYTRCARFSDKIVAAWLGRTNYKPSPAIILYLNAEWAASRVRTPEELLTAIASFASCARRPYMHATTLWSASLATPPLPTLHPATVHFINKFFEEIFYVWTRLDLGRPRLPMGQAIVLIVTTFGMCEEAQFLSRFIRRLKCPKRRARYLRLFTKCVHHIVNDRRRRKKFTHPCFERYADGYEKLCSLASAEM